MKPQVDDAGYDLLLESNGIARHLQLKASFHGSRTARQNIRLELAKKPSGCVVWILFDTKTLGLGPLGQDDPSWNLEEPVAPRRRSMHFVFRRTGPEALEADVHHRVRVGVESHPGDVHMHSIFFNRFTEARQQGVLDEVAEAGHEQ